MAYYGRKSGVSDLVPSVGTINTSSTPTEGTVVRWLTEASARIDRVLGSKGYSVPVATTASLADELSSLAELYAGAYVLRGRSLDIVQGSEESRSDTWMDRFESRLKDLVDTNLEAVGATLSSAAKGRSRIRTLQLRRVDGFSGAYADDISEYENTSE